MSEKEIVVTGTTRQQGQISSWLVAIAILAASAAALTSLSVPRAIAQDENSGFDTRVRFLHANINEGDFEIALNGDGVLDEFSYGSLSDWIPIDPGTVQVTITEDRAGINTVFFDTVYPVPAGNDYLVVITDALVLSTAVDRSPIRDGAARVHVAHAAVDLPAVNVIATGTDTTLASQLSFAQTSDYVEVPAGSVDIDVRLAETGESAFTQTGIPLTGGMVYSLVIVGAPGDDDHELMIVPVDDTTFEQGGTPES